MLLSILINSPLRLLQDGVPESGGTLPELDNILIFTSAILLVLYVTSAKFRSIVNKRIQFHKAEERLSKIKKDSTFYDDAQGLRNASILRLRTTADLLFSTASEFESNTPFSQYANQLAKDLMALSRRFEGLPSFKPLASMASADASAAAHLQNICTRDNSLKDRVDVFAATIEALVKLKSKEVNVDLKAAIAEHLKTLSESLDSRPTSVPHNK